MKIRCPLLQIRSTLYVTILALSHQNSIQVQTPSSNAIDQKPARVQTAPAPALVPGPAVPETPRCNRRWRDAPRKRRNQAEPEAEQRRHTAHTAAPTRPRRRNERRPRNETRAPETEPAPALRLPRVSPCLPLPLLIFAAPREKQRPPRPSGDAAALSPRARWRVACGVCRSGGAPAPAVFVYAWLRTCVVYNCPVLGRPPTTGRSARRS